MPQAGHWSGFAGSIVTPEDRCAAGAPATAHPVIVFVPGVGDWEPREPL